MKILKFTLTGKTAFFKKPDVNTYKYFTYGNIHKIALLGILGANLGLKGYSFQHEETFPEFYEKLKDMKVSIVPQNDKGYINKKIQMFNNSVGYASKEKGGNLIVKEQWLENPKWQIFIILDDSNISKQLEENFRNKRFKYVPYLGKNDHYANIENINIVQGENVRQVEKINSLFLKEKFEVIFDEEDDFDFSEEGLEDKWKYEERLPIALEEETNQYITKPFIFTNMKVRAKSNTCLDSYLYKVEDKILFFF